MNNFMKRIERIRRQLGQEKSPVIIVYADGTKETMDILDAVIAAGSGAAIADFSREGLSETAISLLDSIIHADVIIIDDICED
jgi:hypothetical protein